MEELGALVATRTIVDARNKLDADRWTAAGWTVIGLGTASRVPSGAAERVLAIA